MKKSKWLVTADWHFTNKNSKFRYNKNGVSDLLVAQLAYVKWLAELLDSNEYDGLIMAGDGTDYATLDPITATYFYDAVQSLVATGKEIILLEGNHCILDDASVYTVVGALNHVLASNCHCVTVQEKISFKEKHGVIFHCVPYKSDYKALEGEIEDMNNSLEKGVHNVMLFHFPTTNAILDNGVQSVNGVNLSEGYTNKFTVCLGGDFHKPQQLVNNSNAHYVGAPFDLKMNQKGERGLVVLELDKKGGHSLSRLDNPFNYVIASMSPSDTVALIEDGKDLARYIIKVLDPPTDEERQLIESHRSKFYSINVPSIGRIKQEKSESVKTIQAFSKDRDLDIIKGSLDRAGLTVEMKQKAMDIFQKIKEEV